LAGGSSIPHLFLFCAEGLSYLLSNAVDMGSLQRQRICHNAPIVSHLLFADDMAVFCRATVQQADFIRDILGLYEATSGQKINFEKTNLAFSKGVTRDQKDAILRKLDIKEVLAYEKYLGLPTFVGRSKKKAFLPIKDRIYKCL